MECTIFLTEYCNLKCSYCYQGVNKKNTDISLTNIENSLDYIIENNINNEFIDLNFMGGEPLLKKDMIYKFIDLINSKYKIYKHLFRYNITTNCTLMDDKIIEFFKVNNFTLRLSIDGDKQTNDLNRLSLNGQDYYDLIIKNIKKIIKLNINYDIRMTVSNNNVNLLYKNILYFYSMGIKNFCIGINYLSNWNSSTLDILDKQLDLIKDFYLDILINKKMDITIDLFDGKFISIIVDRKPLFCAAGLKRQITISSNGDIYPCSYVVNDNKWKIGNINTYLDTKTFYKSIKNNLSNDINCNNCSINFTCHGRKCGFLNYTQTGYVNKSSNNLCLIEKIIYTKNSKIIKTLYDSNNHKVLNICNFIKKKNISFNKKFKEIINNND